MPGTITKKLSQANNLALAALADGGEVDAVKTTTTELNVQRAGERGHADTAWLHIAEGVLSFNGVELITGDGASSEAPGMFRLTASQPTEAILFDLH